MGVLMRQLIFRRYAMDEYLKPFKNIVNYNDDFWNKELLKDLKELDRIAERFDVNQLTK